MSFEIASWVIVALALTFIMFKHLVPGLIAGLGFFLLLDRAADFLGSKISNRAVRPLSLLAAIIFAGAVLAGAAALLIAVFRMQASNLPKLMTKMAEIIESTKAYFGAEVQVFFPEAVRDAEDMKRLIVDWLKEHSAAIRIAGGNFGFAIVHMVMGIFLATMVFFRNIVPGSVRTVHGPLGHLLGQKIVRFSNAFSQIVVAQVKISAINTVLTAVYLLVILPLFGRPLPFAFTIVVITFACGLIPVLGNLISNTVIFVVSLGISVGTAVASLCFLVIIHKLEYFVNSRIVGGETDSQAWEILMAIIVGETAFGIQGVVMGPIIYAFVKRELRDRRWV